MPTAVNEGKPKILYMDIETTPNMAAIWRPGKQHVGYDQILKRSQIMSISWAWDDTKVKAACFDLNKYDWYAKDDDADFRLVKMFEELTRSADVVVAHNGKKFDVAVLRARMIKYNLPDFKPFLVDDTYTMTKDIAFMSHKLDDLGEFLDIGRKKPHGNGYEWWVAIMRGDDKTLTNMMKYNAVDVERLRGLYKRIKPYTKTGLNMAIFTGERGACSSCGKVGSLIARGYHYTTAGKRRSFQCKVCGKYQSEGKNLIKKPGEYQR